jgi:hypothetical protein
LRRQTEQYLADALRLGILDKGMIVELFGLTTELGDLTADESKEALVDGLPVAFVGQGFGSSWVRLEVRRVKLGIQLMQDVTKSYPISQSFESLGIAVQIKDTIDLVVTRISMTLPLEG